jgi:menaquinone-dependent protoporphyrinogen oxidase
MEDAMRVLVTWGSKRGGTEGIACMIAASLRHEQFEVEILPAWRAHRAKPFDAAIVGGALYANRWHEDARHFVLRCGDKLSRVPVWFFSSGPLDDSADRGTILPTREVLALMKSVGAQGHATFGGRLLPDAHGFPANAMAKKHAGDFRNETRIRAWAAGIARALPAARPGEAIPLPGRPLARVFAHALGGWAACAAIMAVLLRVASPGVAVALHTVAVPFVFLRVARRYFRPDGARDPLPVALAFAALVALLDLVFVSGAAHQGLAIFRSVFGMWVPLASIVLVTWVTGAIMAMMPFPASPKRELGHQGSG